MMTDAPKIVAADNCCQFVNSIGYRKSFGREITDSCFTSPTPEVVPERFPVDSKQKCDTESQIYLSSMKNIRKS